MTVIKQLLPSVIINTLLITNTSYLLFDKTFWKFSSKNRHTVKTAFFKTNIAIFVKTQAGGEYNICTLPAFLPVRFQNSSTKGKNAKQGNIKHKWQHKT